MKSIFLSILSLFCFFIGWSQNVLDTIAENQVEAHVNRYGHLFNNHPINAPGYEVPKGSGNHLLYATFFWFSGTDESEQRRGVINMFYTNEASFPGPYSSTNDYFSHDYLKQYQENLWTLTRSEIEYHIDNHQEEGYIAPKSILEWPGNGDTAVGVAAQLAPYVDLNNNGVYEPNLGEYPCIKGDVATYLILNDDKFPSSYTQGSNMELEFHYMIYQYSHNNDFIDTTTFIDITVHNRGIHSYSDFNMAYYVDADVGFAFDDYFGTSPDDNMIYFYNATNHDNHYGENPPAVGTKLLNHKAEYGGYYINSGGPIDPWNSLIHFWNMMNGKWWDGKPWVYGGFGYPNSHGATDTPTNFLYTGKPWLNEGWTELNTDDQGTANPNDEDKRGFIVAEKTQLSSGDKETYSFAIITSRKGDHLENVEGIIELSPEVQAFYETTILTSSCVTEGTGETDDFSFTVEEINPYLEFEITRIDGLGNMLNNQELTTETKIDILENNFTEEVTYERTKGPISVWITDTINHASGYFELAFHSYNQSIDSALWTINRYEHKDGPLIESVDALQPIGYAEIQEIPDWGIAVLIEPYLSPCTSGAPNCAERERRPQVIDASMEFKDPSKQWLTGLKHLEGVSPFNWISSGNRTYEYSLDQYFSNSFPPSCFNDLTGTDPFYTYANILGGIVSSGQLARVNNCGFSPVQTPSFVNLNQYASIRRNYQPSVYHPGVDIVFTDDKELWTRCPVIEMNSMPELSLSDPIFGDTPEPGLLRQSLSVDKNGKKLGDIGYNAQEANPTGDQPVGMGWFPGYAIDVESGRRLNMAFGENSMLLNDNGGDMIWNPTSNVLNSVGNPIFGGQHVVYVFGGELNEMPNYDEGRFIHDKLKVKTVASFREAYSNLSWVMQPLLEEGKTLLETEVTLRIRIGKEYQNRVISGKNNGRPMFGWTAVPYNTLNQPPNTSFIHIFPNPSSESITVVWDDPAVESVKIYDMSGQLVYNESVATNIFEKHIPVHHLQSGIYLVHLHDKTRKIVISR